MVNIQNKTVLLKKRVKTSFFIAKRHIFYQKRVIFVFSKMIEFHKIDVNNVHNVTDILGVQQVLIKI